MLKTKTLSMIVVMGLTFVLLFAGLAQAQEARIGLAISTLNNPFFVTLRDNAEETAEELGVELSVADAQNDAAKQMSSVENLLARQVDLIAINPVDSDAVASAIKAANTANVPVITVDRGASGGEVVTHIASDNVEGGEMAANYIMKELNEKGNIVELEGIPGTSAARDRGKGFHNIVDEIEDVEVVASQPAGFDRSEGMTVMENILQAHNEIDAVFAHNDSMALGALEAIEAADREDEIMVVGFDAIDDAVEAVEEGRMAATIAQKPGLMGEMAIETAMKVIEGEDVEEDIPVPLELVTD